MTRPISLIMIDDKRINNERNDYGKDDHVSYDEHQSYNENDLSVETINAIYNQRIMMLTKATASSQKKQHIISFSIISL